MTKPDDWTFLVGQAFLDAAVSCGAVCDRRFVSLVAEGLPPGCDCQLVALVTEGWEPVTGKACDGRFVVTVRLVLDLCVPDPGPDSAVDPEKMAAAASAAAQTRWLMQRGLREAWRLGEFCGFSCDPDDPMPPGAGCADVRPSPWTATVSQGSSVRYETTWRLQS